MYLRTREESLQQLSEMIRPEQLRKAITQGYTDVSLSVIADFKPAYAEMLIKSSYTPETINKLTDAYVKDKIGMDDMFRVIDYSDHTTRNEPYVDAFLESIDNGVYHETAAKTFAAVNFERCSYNEAINYVKSGAFYPTYFSSLSVTDNVAKELHEMGVSLRACEGFNYCYDISDLKEAFRNGAAIFVADKELAVKVSEMMKLHDWEQFRDEVRYIMGQNIGELTGEKLSELRFDYITENYSVALYDKVKAEYDSFIADIKKESADVIVESAYEIVIKDEITNYCQEYTPRLTEQHYEALLSSKNILHEVYEQWCNNGELHGLEDIGIALEETADRIKVSLDREREMKQAAVDKVMEAAPEQKKEQTVMPKRKSR